VVIGLVEVHARMERTYLPPWGLYQKPKSKLLLKNFRLYYSDFPTTVKLFRDKTAHKRWSIPLRPIDE